MPAPPRFSLSSPVDVPLIEKEPLLGLREVDVNVLVDAADDEHFVIVANGLRAEELLRLPERAFLANDFPDFSI